VTSLVLLTGAAGQLGTALRRTAPAGTIVVPTDRATLDLTDERAVHALIAVTRPTIIINTAAYTAVDRAEAEPELAQAINVAAASILAREAARIGARMIQLSTDYVFGPSNGVPRLPADATMPLSVYGRTKRDGEDAVLRTLGDSALIMRTAWLYSSHSPNFVTGMLRQIREREVLRVVCDQIGTPTWARGLADVIWRATAAWSAQRIVHWTDAGVASWYDFAVAIQEEGLQRGLLDRAAVITPIHASDYPTAARRPHYSVLDTSNAVAAFGLAPAHWRTNLRSALDEVPHA
jgi:dTDP-4-dehydrorhamnose reductase